MNDSKESKMSENLNNASAKVVDSMTGRNADQTQKSDKNWLVMLLLSFFLGYLGIHRFYAGKIGTGIVWLFTGGCLGIGWLVDFIRVICGGFKDKEGKLIKN
ncbi:MAG: TM2 domain-containing protein [Malacoplasma sp.]|nr:TM2 domain-containing protein [Malacoplasma sp.]